MTIEKAQEVIDSWIKSNGVRYFNELTHKAVLMEEEEEVARIMARKYVEQSLKKSDENVDLANELADVLLELMCNANKTRIDLTSALKKNLEKKTIRDAHRHKNNEKLK